MEKERKTILLCGNGRSGESIPVIKSWGYKVFLISEFPNDNGVDSADLYINAYAKDPQMALEAAKSIVDKGLKFDGVISLCTESAISVATITDYFGLPGVSLEVAKNASHKDKRSQIFLKNGVSAPKYGVVSSFKELTETVKGFKFPVVIKPVDLSFAKGTTLVEDTDGLEEAFEYAMSCTKSSSVVVNEYIKGIEYSTEGLMIGGNLYLTAISERVFKYEEFKPYFIEVGDIMPVTISQEVQDELKLQTKKAALALEIFDGVVKGDLIVDARGEVFVFELAARLGGPRFGTEMVPLSNGTNILKPAIQQALGEEIEVGLLDHKYSKGMVNRAIFPKPGIVKNVSGLDKLRNCQGFHSFKWFGDGELSKGDEVKPYKDNSSIVGYFIAYGDTREEALENADIIEDKILIETA